MRTGDARSRILRAALTCICAGGVAAVTAACAAGDVAADARWTGTRDTVNGVEVVRNPASPLLGADDVAVSPLWTAPVPSAAPTAGRPLWERPAVVRVADGTVYVLDRMARRIYALDAADGRWTATFGRPGGGPGEFERPQDIAVLGDTLVVLDGGEAALDLLDATGRYVRSIHPNAILFGILPLAPDGLLTHPFTGGEEAGWTVIRLDGTRTPFTFPASATPDPDPFAGCERVSTAGRQVLRTSCTALRFQILDSRGTPLREVVVDRPRAYASEAAIEAAIGRMRARMQRDGLPRAVADRVLADIPEDLRRAPRIVVPRRDPGSGRYALRVQVREELGGGDATLHLFSPGGIYLAELHFDREWVDFDIAGGTIFALVRDPESDLVRLVAYRITLPEPGAPSGGD